MNYSLMKFRTTNFPQFSFQLLKNRIRAVVVKRFYLVQTSGLCLDLVKTQCTQPYPHSDLEINRSTIYIYIYIYIYTYIYTSRYVRFTYTCRYAYYTYIYTYLPVDTHTYDIRIDIHTHMYTIFTYIIETHI
jgi:hypothetical protein